MPVGKILAALPYLLVLIAVKVLLKKLQNSRHELGEATASVDTVYVHYSRSSASTLERHVTNLPGLLPSLQQDHHRRRHLSQILP